jgi:hypothetical protein
MKTNLTKTGFEWLIAISLLLSAAPVFGDGPAAQQRFAEDVNHIPEDYTGPISALQKVDLNSPMELSHQGNISRLAQYGNTIEVEMASAPSDGKSSQAYKIQFGGSQKDAQSAALFKAEMEATSKQYTILFVHKQWDSVDEPFFEGRGLGFPRGVADAADVQIWNQKAHQVMTMKEFLKMAQDNQYHRDLASAEKSVTHGFKELHDFGSNSIDMMAAKFATQQSSNRPDQSTGAAASEKSPAAVSGAALSR